MKPAELRAWRERLGMTQEQAAKALGITRRSFVRYEMGQREITKPLALACGAIEAGILEYPPRK
jgi:DNA-binding XRE family transcriptional regulator